jgi:hypothetical protein
MTDPEPFEESGMTFGPFPPGCAFRIEKSCLYQAMSGDGSGVKVAEMLLLRGSSEDRTPAIWIIEAKQSFPRPTSRADFEKNVERIRCKLADSLSLFFAMRLGRHADALAELPDQFQAVDPGAVDIKLVLIVKGHREKWLPPLNDMLNKALRPLVRVWGLKPTAVTVTNDDGALRHGLISAVGVT